MAEKREKFLRVRYSETEWNALKQQAQEAGLSLSALVRDHAGKRLIRNRQDERERIILLNRINANLNMIARWVNTHKSRAETVQVVSH
ncbi:hypothetical protein GM556_08560, partial [Bombella sp. ESL0378]|uniref:plasmid mobilization protein n=1 Tax=Bombella sp. ESL0378 TaxID=2676442 RepID=UPI0012D9151E